MSDACLFCRIASGELKVNLLAETANAVAFRDIQPQAPVHFLVIPRQHVDSLAEAGDSALLGEMLRLAADVARSEGIEPRGYRTVINTGEHGGQSVFHLHVHVLGGRALSWPPG